MKKSVAVFTFLIVAINALREEELWTDFKKSYDKVYKSLREENVRFAIFQSNVQTINKHNEKFERGEETYTLGINRFADMTDEEFENHLGYKDPEIDFLGRLEQPINYTAPHSVDWRSIGAVMPVKDQLDCGSCWAFSALGALEGQNVIKHGIKEEFSVQELLDCSISYGNLGCVGGQIYYAFEYIRDNGISTASSYPYVALYEDCNNNTVAKATVKVKGYRDISPTENALQAAVASVGPISVGIEANKIKLYHSGIFNNPKCKDALDHAVLVVGYGSEGRNEYWIAKNSWGESWGEKGYIRMSRNKDNQCGIASKAIYPVIA